MCAEEFGNSFFHLSLTTPVTTENSNSSYRLEICCVHLPQYVVLAHKFPLSSSRHSVVMAMIANRVEMKRSLNFSEECQWRIRFKAPVGNIFLVSQCNLLQMWNGRFMEGHNFKPSFYPLRKRGLDQSCQGISHKHRKILNFSFLW